MFYQTESKLQAWRALAILTDRREQLIYVGRSTTQIRNGYACSFLELFDEEEERAQVESIEMQCWNGAADRGHWVTKGTLPIPTSAAKEAKLGGPILPFRKPMLTASEKSDEELIENFKKKLATTA